MCYCKTGTNDLTKSIDAAENKIPQVSSALEKAEATKTQLEKDLKEHRANVADAKQTISTATALRQKEAAAFAKESSDLKTNLAALGKATAAIEGGMAGSFLQNTAATAILQRITLDADMSSPDREMLSAFLSQGQGLPCMHHNLLASFLALQTCVNMKERICTSKWFDSWHLEANDGHHGKDSGRGDCH